MLEKHGRTRRSNQQIVKGGASTKSTSPLLVSSDNNSGARSLISSPPSHTSYVTRGRIECEVQNWTSRRSRSCHSWQRCPSFCSGSVAEWWMVICWRYLDLIVWSTVMIHRALDVAIMNFRCLSFVALERSSKSVLDAYLPASEGEVLVARRSRRKLTQREVNEGEKFQGVNTPRH